VRTGLAAHEIVEAARELDSDLIVIATHGYTGWKHLCIGSTTERVVRTAPCPVFVVREKQHELF
jgi:nucleotide-binding universal stress UspA family protein